MSKFKVGDIVRGISSRYGITNKHMSLGRVMSVYHSDEFDEDIISIKILKHVHPEEIGQTYSGLLPKHFELVEPYQDWKVLIVPRGDTTIAKLYKNNAIVKTVECKKHPDDEYSMDEAIKVVTERLREPQYYNGKVVCVKVFNCNDSYHTLGKIYQVKDGFFKLDDGTNYPTSGKQLISVDDLNKRSCSEWLEVVE